MDKLNNTLQFSDLSTYIRTADRILNNAIETVTEDIELIDTNINSLESDNADSFQVWNTTRILDHEFKELNKEWNILEEKENDWAKEYEGDDDSIELFTIELWNELNAIQYSKFDEYSLSPSTQIITSIAPLNTQPSTS